MIDSKNTDYDMDHSMNLALIDPSGKYHGFFKTPYTPEMMAEALESVIKIFKLVESLTHKNIFNSIYL